MTTSQIDADNENQISAVIDFLNNNEEVNILDTKKDEEKVDDEISKKEKKTKKDKFPSKKEKKRKAMNEDEIVERNKRTVFVGNVPLKDVSISKLLKILKIEKSIVETVRFRSLPLEEKYADKKRLGVLRKKFTDVKDNKNALVTLKDEKDVPLLLERNGTIYEGYVLRVNKFGDNKSFSRKKSICIKNLCKKLNEKDLYEIMKGVDTIKGVRILRDTLTSMSTGTAFILFENRSAVKKAIQQFNGYTINDRQIIVEKVQDDKEKKGYSHNEKSSFKKKNKEKGGNKNVKKDFTKKFNKYKSKKKKYMRRRKTKEHKNVVKN
ncbi:large subunit rRNA processing RRM protein, putative [Plasmodium sp. gorilla clade G2]|uniref:large subunit rRNA processing RRM protein, putative n=1 Tax=Plasmodium sp. gorilla clade G2 TaxID=880535 RepID=UPI000D208D59|nr:large subunit rRNA processing RRM protein, putative [Plasmodium sp. gorilla clade G2]SOV14911.1 large subunit rRNA processing RRM protein, putative [Plasmodium sp. gorilla clade G2]